MPGIPGRPSCPGSPGAPESPFGPSMPGSPEVPCKQKQEHGIMGACLPMMRITLKDLWL